MVAHKECSCDIDLLQINPKISASTLIVNSGADRYDVIGSIIQDKCLFQEANQAHFNLI